MTIEEDIEEKLKTLVEPIVEELQLVLVDLIVKRRKKDIFIELSADKPFGGVTIDECTHLNRRLSEKIEEQGLLDEGYNLEVSSPGLDRPLKTRQDFQRVMQRNIHFFLLEPVHEKREYVGIVKKVEDNQVVVDVNSSELTIPLRCIDKALQVIS